MAELIQFKEGDVLVCVRTDNEDAIMPTSTADDAIRVLDRSLADAFRTCQVVAAEFSKCVKPLVDKLESAEIEVGFQFTASGSLYVVALEGQAALKAKFVCIVVAVGLEASAVDVSQLDRQQST